MIVFAASFSTVFLLVFQQQNVTHKLYYWAILTSFGITLSQVYVIRGIVADAGNYAIVMMMAGGAIGVTASMYIHGRLVKLYNKKQVTRNAETA